QRRRAHVVTVERVRKKFGHVFAGERCEDDVLDRYSSTSDPIQGVYEWMGRGDFVVPVCADQQHMSHIGVSQQVFEQIQRGRVEPLQIVEEQRQRMFRSSEYREEAAEDELKTSLGVLRWQLVDRRLLANDESQLRNQVQHELPVRTEGFTKRLTAVVEFDIAPSQKGTDQTRESLRQGGIRNIALVLVELAGGEQGARRNE